MCGIMTIMARYIDSWEGHLMSVERKGGWVLRNQSRSTNGIYIGILVPVCLQSNTLPSRIFALQPKGCDGGNMILSLSLLRPPHKGGQALTLWLATSHTRNALCLPFSPSPCFNFSVSGRDGVDQGIQVAPSFPARLQSLLVLSCPSFCLPVHTTAQPVFPLFFQFLASEHLSIYTVRPLPPLSTICSRE